MAKKYIIPQIVVEDLDNDLIATSYSTDDEVQKYAITGVGYANFEETANSKNNNTINFIGNDD